MKGKQMMKQSDSKFSLVSCYRNVCGRTARWVNGARTRQFIVSSLFVSISAMCAPVSAWGALPTRCLDIATAHPGAPDGTYWIFPNNQAFQVYCKGMGTSTPAEYLTLVNTGSGINFSQYTAGGASPGSNVVTTYTKVWLDPATLLVNTGDQTFSSSTGSLVHSNDPNAQVTSMPYATAMSCDGSASGIANVDITGTPFKVTDPFQLGGFGPSGTTTFSSGNQVVNLTGGGFCGWNAYEPTPFNPFNGNGDFQLNLGYIVNIAPIDIQPGTFPNAINIGSGGVTPVAILSTATFDASQVNPALVKFGPTGTEASPIHNALQDVNADGRLDLVLQFRTQDTAVVCGQDFELMTIVTFSNQQYLGFDSITTVPCK